MRIPLHLGNRREYDACVSAARLHQAMKHIQFRQFGWTKGFLQAPKKSKKRDETWRAQRAWRRQFPGRVKPMIHGSYL